MATRERIIRGMDGTTYLSVRTGQPADPVTFQVLEVLGAGNASTRFIPSRPAVDLSREQTEDLMRFLLRYLGPPPGPE